MSVLVHSATDLIFATANLPNPTNWTAFAWIKLITNTTADVRYLLRLNDAGPTDSEGLDFVGGGNTLQLNSSAGSNSFGASPTPPTGWVAYAISCSGIGAGSLQGYWRQNADTAWTTGPSVAGVSFAPTEFDLFNFGLTSTAEVRYLRIWDAVLSAAELSIEFGRPDIARLANVRLNCPLNNAATAGNDISGNGFNMTVFGTPVDGSSEPVFTVPAGMQLL